MSLGRSGGALVAVGGVLGILAVAIAALGGQVRWAEACWQWFGCDRQSGGATGVEHRHRPDPRSDPRSRRGRPGRRGRAPGAIVAGCASASPSSG